MKKKIPQSKGRKERRTLEAQEKHFKNPRYQRWIRTADWALKKDIPFLADFIDKRLTETDDYPIGKEDPFSELGHTKFSRNDQHAIRMVYQDKFRKRIQELGEMIKPATESEKIENKDT